MDPNAGEPIQAPSQQGGGLADTVASALPTIGAIPGGILGGVGGAALGGAAGQGYGEMLKHAGEIPGAIADVARHAFSQPAATLQGFLTGAGEGAARAGLAGGTQATGQVVGKGIGAGLNLLGKGIYRGGVALLPKSIKQEFATKAGGKVVSGGARLAKAGFDEGIALTERGAAKASRVADDVSDQVSQKLAAMERVTPPIQPREVTPALRSVRDVMQKRADLGKPNEIPDLAVQAKTFGAKHKGGLRLTRANELKRQAQADADAAYAALSKGNIVKDTGLLTDRAMAHGLREAIENRVPSVAPLNERLQGLIGLRQGAEHAAGTGHILSRLGGAGVLGGLGLSGGVLPALAAAGAGAALTTPGGATATGLGFKAAAPVAEQGSARLLALLAQLLAEDQ